MEAREEFARNALRDALSRFSRSEIAEHFDINIKTLDRWENERIPSPGLVSHALSSLLGTSRKKSTDSAGGDSQFTFIDLFAGIGGIRMGFEAHGGRCVYTSEWDKYSQKTYRENFADEHVISGDITKVEASEIPDHDVLLAGFPCQPFSIAGVSKKNSLGRVHGFKCETQGTLFFDIARIIDEKRPAAFMLENVKNLTSHDRGRTFDVIKRTLTEELGYRDVHYRILDARHFVPQHRERIVIVGFRESTDFSWGDLRLAPPEQAPRLNSILHPEDGSEEPENDYTLGRKAEVNPKYTLSAKLWKYLRDYAEKHKARGNGFGFGLVGPDDIARTLSARYFKDGSEILISRGPRRNPRRLTPRECARLMGYPDSFSIPVSDTQAYKQFGNSVAMPVFREVARIMYPHVMTIKGREAAARTGQEILL